MVRGVERAARGATRDEVSVSAPFLGVVTVLVDEGDRVVAGQPLAVIEAMKMEASITAPSAGRVARVGVRGTRSVAGGDLLVVLVT